MNPCWQQKQKAAKQNKKGCVCVCVSKPLRLHKVRGQGPLQKQPKRVLGHMFVIYNLVPSLPVLEHLTNLSVKMPLLPCPLSLVPCASWTVRGHLLRAPLTAGPRSLWLRSFLQAGWPQPPSSCPMSPRERVGFLPQLRCPSGFAKFLTS